METPSASEANPQQARWYFAPLFWVSLAFILGIILAYYMRLTIGNWLLLGATFLILTILHRLVGRYLLHTPSVNTGGNSNFGFYFRRAWMKMTELYSRTGFPISPGLFLTIVAFGAARYQASIPVFSPSTIAYYNDSQHVYIVEGVIVKPPDFRDVSTNLILQVDKLRPNFEVNYTDVDGLLLADVAPDVEWHYGDRVRLQGELRTPFTSEEFSYRDYLARRGIHSVLRSQQTDLIGSNMGNPLLNAIYVFRERALETIYQLFPDPEASLFAGILLGMESGIPDPVQDAFNTTGTSHIIAISGFNIAVLSSLLAMMFGRLLGRWRAVIATLVGISFYTILVGADPSVLRAAIMGGLSLLAVQLGRRQAGLNSLAMVAALMALANPMLLWDLSFQLSFFATLGMILYAELFSDTFTRIAGRWVHQTTLQRITGPVSEYFLVTLAAQVLTIPVITYQFSRTSLVSLVANPTILPAQPPLMILGGISTLLGVFFLPIGKIVAAFAWPFALYTIRMVEFFARIPKGEIVLGDVALPSILFVYAAIFALTFAGIKMKDNLKKIQPAIPLAGLFIATLLVWQLVFSQPDSKLHMTLLNVSTQGRSGHAILIVTPTGRRMLINGGPYTSLLSDALGRRLPWNDHHLDWLIVASTGQDELTALPRTTERFPADNILWAGATHGNSASRNLWEALTLEQIPVTMAESGQALELGAGARLKLLTVSQRGAVLLLEWTKFRALLPLGMDLDYLEETEHGRKIGAVNVLLLAESGYAPVNPPEWITNLNPQLILLSVAADDYKGLPSPETLQAIEGYEVLRTDQNGWIELTTDGEQMWVEVERK